MRVLVADADLEHNRHLKDLLETWGNVVQTASLEDATLQLTAFAPDVVLTSFPIAPASAVPVILMTSLESTARAVEKVDELGAFWFVEKPAAPDTLRVLLKRAAQYGRLAAENAKPTAALPITIGMRIDEAERVLLEATLSDLGNNKTHAARALGISAKTLHQKLRQYRLEDARQASGQPEPRNAGA
jgi:DNA-binding NtrC family response regulator